jgi:hypothetical protein
MYCVLAVLPTYFASLHLLSSPLAFTFTEQSFLRHWYPMRYRTLFRFPISLPVILFIFIFHAFSSTASVV